MIARITDPRTTCLIFRTGKIIVTGAKTVEDSQTACKRIAKAIQKASG